MISLIFWFLASIVNGAMDMNFNMYSSSRFTKLGIFWNPYESSGFKWKNGDRSQGEKFFGSSTFLVWLTDSWHLFKMLFLVCLLSSILSAAYFEGVKVVANTWFNLLIVPIIYAGVWFVGFESTCKLLKLK